MSITVVTVTYGRRSHFLIQTLDAARAQGVAEAVVIDNGAAEPISDILRARYGDWALVHRLDSNRGSAVGFKTGIEQAMPRPSAYLLLLDDDNVVAGGCIETLKAAFVAEWLNTDPAHLIGFAFRADRHQWMIDRACGIGTPCRHSSFRGFHVLDIWSKITKRLRISPPPAASHAAIPRTIYVEKAAYGGMLFHKSLLQTIGLPDEKFFLYEDDTEYTARLIAKGGKILLVTGARIFDCDTSWNLRHATATSFAKLLDRDAGARRFYAFRNGVFLDLRGSHGNRLIVLVNLLVYMAILLLFSLFKGRLREFMLLGAALRDGVTGNFNRKLHDDAL